MNRREFDTLNKRLRAILQRLIDDLNARIAKNCSKEEVGKILICIAAEMKLLNLLIKSLMVSHSLKLRQKNALLKLYYKCDAAQRKGYEVYTLGNID